ncbi:UDP-N-acetylglucosamine-N-acetylmuramylpentapeptide N-acetylglucosamine transferase [Ectothiorhodosinus mongolicus]|uniref:UDP-N-acetylglucosamine--N-acetylmuramyl-(pentapeptide) pyrophosphoryl-undecaprenol N-acetylglucosamine transferase n=1 Tax=Ectothiorhodosinus mongolicus TaxID=233100 RepID=A0A1R3VQ61_9GAMM|nr:undecaprenyldiphospho-muramoylpentapeptide beta-N-acetylglucosaminyltransferase [Ectothiorhodosinus mongolicus]ULX56682.1 undecaprenyldiphospho-muramoylpentapeptide beta-N-acetylglucosaminyltransferase [Ectothiorhodosinus mongolicus]SIT66792.1 UDP-N-acetylglucosamine-N-acetylmuramylpentapeptide N-acetylglucosamine transferase [Ectothiorhodosinus mongolicus]
MSGARILVMAGGTGGHVFPGLAVAKLLRQQGHEVRWLGTATGLEARLVPAANITLHTLPVSGLRGKGLMTWLLAPWKLGVAMWAALGLLWRLKPRAVLGLGGFASGPGGLVAAALGYPLVIHEQNAIAGMTNRWLAKRADLVLQAFPGTFAPALEPVTVGNPVRTEIADLPAPEQRYAQRSGPLQILVVGGSLGALALNTIVPQALAQLPADTFVVRHQAGERTLAQAQQAYTEAGVVAEVTAFIEDMAAAYAGADVVICRAGALTVSELAAAGVASILVPFPHAVDDHQTANAAYLTDVDAALLLPQSELSAERLAETLKSLDRDRLQAMAVQARQQAKVDATEQVARACQMLAEGGGA